MMIKTISATGLKCGDFSHNLARVNAIIGPNAVGKTSVLDAVRLACIGYLPELGKQNAATFELARGAAMSVEAVFDDKTTIQRGLKRNGKGAINALTSGTTLHDTIPTVMLDPSTYFFLGDKDRVRYVFGCSKMDDKWLGVTILAELRKIKLADWTESHEATLHEVMDEVNASDDARLDSGDSIQDWVESLIASHSERLKTAKATVQRLEKTTQGITQVAQDAVAVADHTTEIEAKRQEMATVEAKLSELRRAILRIESTASERRQIKQRLAAIPSDINEQVAKYQGEVERMEKATAGYDAGPVNRLSAKRIELAGTIRSAETQRNDIFRNRDAVDRKLKEITDKDCCPYCKSKKAGWKSAVIAELNEQYGRHTNDAMALETKALETQAELDKLQVELKAAIDAENANALATKQLREANTSLRQAQDKAAAKAQLESRLAALTVDGDVETLNTQAAGLGVDKEVLQGKIEALESLQRAYNRAKLEEQQAAQVQIETAKAAVERDVLASVVQTLERLQREMVDQAFGKIIATANRLVGDILKTPLAYKDGEIGRAHGQSGFISHRTFSGTEKALAYAAISVALAADSPFKLVMIDELDRLDHDNKSALIERLLAMTESGEIDQAIVVSVGGANDDVFDGVNVISVG